MEDDEGDGRWRMEGEGWRIKNGGWRMRHEGWKILG